MIFRFIRAVEELTKALNRFVDFWETGATQQAEVDGLSTQLKRATAEAKAHLERGA